MDNKFEIDIKGLILFVLRKCYYIVIAAVVMAIVGFSYSKSLTPKYSASALLYVNNYNGSAQTDIVKTSSSDIYTAQMLVQTYLEFLKSSKVLDEVANDLNNEFSADEIKGMMSAAPLNDTEVFMVTITHTDKTVAMNIANMIADRAPDIIQTYIKGSSVEVVDYAKEPTTRSFPKHRKYVMLGGMAGGGIAGVLIVLVFLFNSKIKGKEDLEKLFTAPIVGEIPNFMQAELMQGGYNYEYSVKKIPTERRAKTNVAKNKSSKKNKKKK